MEDITFGCCFCGDAIEEPQSPKEVIFHWGEEENEWQQWWCHLECFAGAIHERARHFAWEDEDLTPEEIVEEYGI